jgi:hypothetical protein
MTTIENTIVTDEMLIDHDRLDTDWFDAALPATEVIEGPPLSVQTVVDMTAVDAVLRDVVRDAVGGSGVVGAGVRGETAALVVSALPGDRAPRTTIRQARQRSQPVTGLARFTWEELESHPARLALVLFISLVVLVCVITARWTVPAVVHSVVPDGATPTPTPHSTPSLVPPMPHKPQTAVKLGPVRKAPQVKHRVPTASPSITPSPSISVPGVGVSAPPVTTPVVVPSTTPVVPPPASSPADPPAPPASQPPPPPPPASTPANPPSAAGSP